MPDYLRYYDLEKYLFDDLSVRYRDGEAISAFDFFCIVIWKANRAKSKMAKKMLKYASAAGSLDGAVAELVADLRAAHDDKGCLQVMMQKWGFRLPMASAILTVFYPYDFTVYDIRACEALGGDFGKIADIDAKKRYDDVWRGYSAFVGAVRASVPAGVSLRDKDRTLWGQSFHDQLQRDIQRQFGMEGQG